VEIKAQAPEGATLLGLLETAFSNLESALVFSEQHCPADALNAFEKTREALSQLRKLSPIDAAFLGLFIAAIEKIEQALASEPGMAAR
jgi:hypothetical protein